MVDENSFLSFRDKIVGVDLTLLFGPEILDGTQLGARWADSPTWVPHRYSAAPSPPTIASSSGATPDPARIPRLCPYGIY